MLYSLKKDRTWENKRQHKPKKTYDNTHPTHTLIWINHFLSIPIPLPPPLSIHNNNTMDAEFLVQMRQSNKCGSARNDEIFNLHHLGSGACPWVSIPSCKMPTTFIDSMALALLEKAVTNLHEILSARWLNMILLLSKIGSYSI